MTPPRADPSRNGHGSPAWSQPWTQLRLDRRSLGHCRVTFDHPPINTITGTTVAELSELVDLIEGDADLRAVVFDTANADHYLAQYDGETTGMHRWIDLLVRLSRAPVVSIAAVRGRAHGAGGDFVLACDLRFASRGKAVLDRFEAEGRYGCFTRAIADGRLDGEVDEIASRLARTIAKRSCARSPTPAGSPHRTATCSRARAARRRGASVRGSPAS